MLERAWPVPALALAACWPLLASAGPVEFGRGELGRAMAARGLAPDALRLGTELRPGPAESFELLADRVAAADERGLMYGLLAAADQVRADGRLTPARVVPRVRMRGIRRFLHNAELEADWYHSREHWDAYFAMLARQRFNRFNLVFAHQTDYLAPPYPFWLELPGFPEIRVPGLAAADRERNLETLRYIAQAAADHGIDFTLGVWQHDIQAGAGMRASVEGLTPENIGPYSHAALKAVLARCPGIRSVQVRTNWESGIPPERQVAFYRDHVFAAIRDAGRPVTLDLRGWALAGEMVGAATAAGVPVRLSAKYWAEHLGRPYQPAETYPGYSYIDLLKRPRPYGFYWELWGLGSHRLLLWGDPGYVRRAVGTFGLGGAEGFEIDPPLAQKGFGNRPGRWGVFADAELGHRRSWTWEWERYWLFYALWGRLSYDPGTPDAVWEAELARRLGAAAAPDAMAAYRSASGILHEIVAAHTPDPNMGIWPEINPGGLVDPYKDALPSDWRHVANAADAVDDRLRGRASARQTPTATAALLDRMAAETEAAVARAGARVGAGSREWLSSEPDFLVLAALARYHARKQRAAEALAWFDATGDAGALARARRELEAGVAVWEGLVRLTDGLYPDAMAYGPGDIGHWKDKLPYVRHDLELVADRERTLARFGPFNRGFDLGGPVPEPAPRGDFLRDPYILRNTVAPRFLPVDAGTAFDAARGYGWLGEGPRDAVAIAPASYDEVRAIARDPARLPADVLLRDAIRGRGAQAFAVATGEAAGSRHTVTLLHADGTTEVRALRAGDDGRLVVPFPDGDWSVSALVVRGDAPRGPVPPYPAESGAIPPRPAWRHAAPAAWRAGEPLTLRLDLPGGGAGRLSAVRLHYRAVNQLARFRTLEAPPDRPVFTIPAVDVVPGADLMYYFEVLHDEGGGWFEPDPHEATPYHVVGVLP